MKNPNQSKLKSTQPANQKTPKANFGTTNLSRILLAHQTLRLYLYPQKPLPQIALYNQQGSYQFTTWPPRPKPQLLPLEEEDPVPHQQHHPLQRPPQQRILSNKSRLPSMLPSAALEEEEAQEEPLPEEEEDRVHLDPQA